MGKQLGRRFASCLNALCQHPELFFILVSQIPQLIDRRVPLRLQPDKGVVIDPVFFHEILDHLDVCVAYHIADCFAVGAAGVNFQHKPENVFLPVGIIIAGNQGHRIVGFHILPHFFPAPELSVLVDIRGIVVFGRHGPPVGADNLMVHVIKIKGHHRAGRIEAAGSQVKGQPVVFIPHVGDIPACFQIQHEIILIVDINHAALHGLNQAVHIVLQIFQGLSHLFLALGVNQIRGSLLEQKRLQQQRRQGASQAQRQDFHVHFLKAAEMKPRLLRCSVFFFSLCFLPHNEITS